MRRGIRRQTADARPLASVIADGGPRGVVVTVPGEDAPVYSVEVPAGLRDNVRRRIAERQLSALLHRPVDALDLRVGPTSSTERAPVLVADSTRVTGWRAAVAKAGIAASAILPDYLALPRTPDGWTIAVEAPQNQASRLVVRVGQMDGFSAPVDFAILQLGAALDRLGRPDRITIAGDPSGPLAHWLADHDLGGVASQVPGVKSESALPDSELIDTFDLLRDDAANAAAIAAALRQWRLPVAVTLIGVLALGSALWLDIRRLEAERLALDTAARDIARDVFLGPAPILSLRQQVAREISTRQGASDAQAPFETLRVALSALNPDAANLRSIAQADSGGFVIELDTDDFGTLEAVQQAIAEAGPRVDIQRSAAQATGGVVAVLGVTADSTQDGGQ